MTGFFSAEANLSDHAHAGLFESNYPMKFVIGLVAGASALCLASSAFAAPPPPIPPGDGAVTNYFFKSDNRAVAVAALTSFMKSVSSTTATGRGICVSRTHATDFFVYAAFPNFEDLLTAQRDNPSADILALWKLQYRAEFKPLMAFKIPSGKTVEHSFRFSVSTKNTDAFVQAASKLNSQLATEIKGASLIVAMPIGGGTNEANVLHVRLIFPDNKSLGMSIDNFFKGSNGATSFKEMWSLSTGMSSTIEDCEQIPIAQK